MVWYIERCQKHTLLKKNYQKKRKKSKQELEQYKNRQPKPAIRFSNSESRIFYFIVPFCNHPQHNWKSHLSQVLLQFCYRYKFQIKKINENDYQYEKMTIDMNMEKVIRFKTMTEYCYLYPDKIIMTSNGNPEKVNSRKRNKRYENTWFSIP